MNRPVIIATIAIAGSALLAAPAVAQESSLTQPNSSATAAAMQAPQRTPGASSRLHSSTEQGDARLLAPGITHGLGQAPSAGDVKLTDANIGKQTTTLASATAVKTPRNSSKLQSMTETDSDAKLLAPGISNALGPALELSDAKLTDANTARQTSAAVTAPKGAAAASAKLQSMLPAQSDATLIAPGISNAPK
jgi:hypothetical protein